MSASNPSVPTYYLYDEFPIAEIDLNGTQINFNLAGATGTELLYNLNVYDKYLGSSGTAYTFDPQGNLSHPVTLYLDGDPPFTLVRSSSAFDAFGENVTFTADVADDPYDPMGFGGQYGYYCDTFTGLYLLTHRYYDAKAGRFVTRDSIG